ncbi:DUF6745 domain-containing protein [Herbidospora mongoliensis]|uniref:DUF6745 domain-containing protein n=1 Tax=Herbidospora mongoliensis TaxID=688067 RepID=UPI0009FDFCFE|nr:hypothetical protein [Herbidospora mongoliensis]
MSVTPQRDAAAIREEWLRIALSTEPADRPEAESAIAGLYRLNGLPPPRFHWVSSPAVAAEFLPPGVRNPREVLTRRFRSHFQETRAGVVPEMSEISEPDWAGTLQVGSALAASRLPFRLVVYDHDRRWNPLGTMARLSTYEAMSWVPRSEGLDLWARVVRAGGWWLPYDRQCVVADRPKAVHTESGRGDTVVVHNADGPAVVYRDGWPCYAWHGEPVPSWVIEGPTVERIRFEPSPGFRRAAIERLGWGEYIARAGLPAISAAPDPGNDAELRLYQAEGLRVLLAVNGTVERDGTRRRYALPVPPRMNDPVEAAAWTYGLTADVYAQLVRRT